MAFDGVPRGLVGFLAGLEAENSREWFEAHRADYEALWLKPALDLAAALSAPVAEMGLRAVPKLNGSVRRINRDVRFSHDKRPYQAHWHLVLSTGPAFNKLPGVHLVISPEGFGYGAGHYGFASEGLERLRRAICDDSQRAGFLFALARAQGQGAELDAPDLVRVPKGFVAEPEWEHLLRRKHIVARTQGHKPCPDWLFGPGCVAGLLPIIADLAPLARWLVPFAG
jgi:uncharacterized protein (TIGR02453 family)